MIVLGIDPGSINTGWALIESLGNKVNYIGSGVLEFNKKIDFLERLTDIKRQADSLASTVKTDEIAFESLIYVKSPTSLIKLAQTRGIILSSFVSQYHQKIYEYSPNVIKATTTGYGHSDKESIQKFIDMLLGKREYQTHDESDAIAIALCHILNKGKKNAVKVPGRKKSSGGLASAVAHKIG